MMNRFPKKLEDLSIVDLLTLLKKSAGKIKERIKEIIKEKIESKKYLISISKDELSNLKRISESDIYKRMEECLGSHWSMNLIALGLYISELNKQLQKELQEKVRKEIHQKYGAEGLKIMEIGSTGAIRQIIEYLSNIKMNKEYDLIQMGRLFDKIIKDWKEITLFIKAEDNQNQIELKISNMISSEKALFIVFAYGSAVLTTCFAIAKLNNNKQLSGYLFYSKREQDIEKTPIYSCFFESVEGFGLEAFA